MKSLSKYDYLLSGIGVMITLMLTGILVMPNLTIISGLAGAILTGLAMFVFGPV